jgi:hypothetical protein
MANKSIYKNLELRRMNSLEIGRIQLLFDFYFLWKKVTPPLAAA